MASEANGGLSMTIELLRGPQADVWARDVMI